MTEAPKPAEDSGKAPVAYEEEDAFEDFQIHGKGHDGFGALIHLQHLKTSPLLQK
jgi:hypothetical protein